MRLGLCVGWPIAAVATAAIAIFSTTSAEGGFSASNRNTANRSQSATVLTAGTVGATSECDLTGATYSPITAANLAACTGTLAASGIVPSSGSAAVSTVVADKGSVSTTSAKLTKSSCGPVQLANAVAAANPMLVRGDTLSYAQSGPLTGTTGLGLSGGASGTGYAANVTLTSAPTTFTEVVWFRTTSNGTLLGFADSPTTAGLTMSDRMLWLDNSGHVVFGVANGSNNELTSPAATYLDGKWHLAAGTVGSAGMVLSVDGATVASNAAVKTATAYNGYWHAGWDNEAKSWTNPPTTPFFAGTLADAAIFPPLTADQITKLQSATTQTAWNGYLTSLAATGGWALGDAGTTAFTGTVPGVSPAACAFIDVTIGVTGAAATCAAPAAASACSAPTSSLTLAALGATTAFTVFPTLAQNVTVFVTIARDATNTVASSPNAAGLHLTVPMTIVAAQGAFSATLSWPTENLEL